MPEVLSELGKSEKIHHTNGSFVTRSHFATGIVIDEGEVILAVPIRRDIGLVSTFSTS